MNIMAYLGQGIDHVRNDRPCQDVIGFVRREDAQQVALALSHGDGEAQYAHEGAQASVRAVLDLFFHTRVGDFLALDEPSQRSAIVKPCQQGIAQLAQEMDCDQLDQFAATLLFAAWDDQQLVVGSIGDGGVFARTKEGTRLLSQPEHWGREARSTDFTIHPQAEAHLHLQVFPRAELDVQTLMLTGDGTWPMLERRGGGRAERAVEELLALVHRGTVRDQDSLAAVLDAMTLRTSDRMEDWSVLVWDRDQVDLGESLPEPDSMLEREKAKRERERRRQEEERKREQPSRPMDQWMNLEEYVKERSRSIVGKWIPPLTPARAARLVMCLCRGLNPWELRNRGDFCLIPQDIQVREEPDGSCACRIQPVRQVDRGQSQRYIAPEVLQGQPLLYRDRALCYSLGGLFLLAIGGDGAPGGGWKDSQLRRVCWRMRQPSPDDRPATLEQLYRELKYALEKDEL